MTVMCHSLLGTSTIGDLKEQHWEKYLQDSQITTAWYLILLSVNNRERDLERNNTLEVVKNVEKSTVTIIPNTNCNIFRYTDKELTHSTKRAMLHLYWLPMSPRLSSYNLVQSFVNFSLSKLTIRVQQQYSHHPLHQFLTKLKSLDAT